MPIPAAAGGQFLLKLLNNRLGYKKISALLTPNTAQRCEKNHFYLCVRSQGQAAEANCIFRAHLAAPAAENAKGRVQKHLQQLRIPESRDRPVRAGRLTGQTTRASVGINHWRDGAHVLSLQARHRSKLATMASTSRASAPTSDRSR